MRRVTTSILFVVFALSTDVASARILNVPREFGTIQAGINATEAGDTVLVQPGIYEENLILTRNPLTLASNYILEPDTTIRDSTIIDGTTRSNVVSINDLGDNPTRIIGLTIRNGFGDVRGGGIHSEGSALEVSHCKISDNIAQSGAGIACFGDIGGRFEYVVFERNNATNAWAGGLWGANIYVAGCRFIENSAHGGGSAINLGGSAERHDVSTIIQTLFQDNNDRAVRADYADLTLRNVDFIGNNDGGLWMRNGFLDYENGRLINNGPDGVDLFYGGGISTRWVNGTLNNLYLAENTSGTNGGGLNIEMNDGDSLIIRNSVFIHNGAREGEAAHISGGYCLLDNISVSLSYLTGLNLLGGGVFHTGGNLEIRNSRFFGNHGYALTSIKDVNDNVARSALLDHVVFSGNTAPFQVRISRVTASFITATNTNENTGLFEADSGIISNCIFGKIWYQMRRMYYTLGLNGISRAGQYSIAYSDIEEGVRTLWTSDGSACNMLDGNIFEDPGLELDSTGRYMLSVNSPCIDSGNPEAPLDPDSTRADMGAIYFNQRGNPPTFNRHIPSELDLMVELGDSIQFIALADDADGDSINYYWLFNEDTVSIDTSLIIVFNDVGESLVKCTIFDGHTADSIEWRISVRDLAVHSDDLDPATLMLQASYPNPFNSATTIRFALPEDSHIWLAVFDLTGREVTELISGDLKAGSHYATWNALDSPAGVYLLTLKKGQETMTRKVVLLP